MMISMQDVAHMDLAERLRAGTRDRHGVTERAGIMPAVLHGQIDRVTYCALLRNLHGIYAALEPALMRRATHAVVGPVVLPALFRTVELTDDLDTLHGPSWAKDLVLEPATASYVRRLHDIETSAPALLVAHAYVRSLGDLSGGQLLRGIVAKTLRLEGSVGTRFFDFGSVSEVAAHRQAFRAALNALPLDEDSAAGIVAEAEWAFERHADLFEQLAARWSAAPVA
jgi:heme oxygenase